MIKILTVLTALLTLSPAHAVYVGDEPRGSDEERSDDSNDMPDAVKNDNSSPKQEICPEAEKIRDEIDRDVYSIEGDYQDARSARYKAQKKLDAALEAKRLARAQSDITNRSITVISDEGKARATGDYLKTFDREIREATKERKAAQRVYVKIAAIRRNVLAKRDAFNQEYADIDKFCSMDLSAASKNEMDVAETIAIGSLAHLKQAYGEGEHSYFRGQLAQWQGCRSNFDQCFASDERERNASEFNRVAVQDR